MAELKENAQLKPVEIIPFWRDGRVIGVLAQIIFVILFFLGARWLLNNIATQAHGSAVVRCGNTILLATVVCNKEAKPDQEFFPLSVDYAERFYAAGRIPGNFFRREAKLNDYEILTSRLVDRAIRPLFPDGFMNETQVMISLLSGETETPSDAFAALAASAALTLSDIPWNGPISEVRIAKVNGEFIINPSRTQLLDASSEFVVAATPTELLMVEGQAKECDESELIEAIKV